MDDKQQRETLFEKHRENIYFRWGLTAFVVLAACIILAQFVSKLTAVWVILKTLLRTLSPVFYGLVIAYLLDPIVIRVAKFIRPYLESRLRRKERAEGMSRAIGVAAGLILAGLLVWALVAMVLPQLIKSIEAIIAIPYYETLSGWLSGFLSDNFQFADYTEQIMQSVYNYLSDWLSSTILPKVQSIVVGLTTGVVGLAREMLNLVIGIIISVYLLLSKKKFLSQTKKICYGVLGQDRAGYVYNVCTYANQVFGGFIGGKLLDSLIIGIISFVVLSIMKMPYAMLISVIVGVTNIIPFFGPFLGAIPSALLLLVTSPIQCLYFIIFVLILQQIDGNIIGPVILGDATGVSGFWVVVSILVFGNFFGIAGMVLAVPTFAVLSKIITEMVNRLLKSRGLSTITEDYEAWNYPPRPHPGHWRRRTRRKKLSAVLHPQQAAAAEPAPSEDVDEDSDESEEA